MLLRNPSCAVTMTAREVHDAIRAGRSLQIVDVPDHSEVKIRKYRGDWPPVTFAAVLDVRDDANYECDEHIVLGMPGDGLYPLRLYPEARVTVIENVT